MYNESRVIMVVSKSSFLLEEQNRRISRGYCRNDRPSCVCVYIYRVGGPIRGHLVVRGRVNVAMEVRISE